MSRILFIADPHLGHKNIHKMRPVFDSAAEHDEWFCDMWQASVTRRDKVFVLGDAAMSSEAMARLGTLKGRKVLIGGNHDNMTTLAERCATFEEIHGIVKYKDFWLTHCPVHTVEIGWAKIAGNIHGHIHRNTVDDWRYLNLCPEVRTPALTGDGAWGKRGFILSYAEIVEIFYKRSSSGIGHWDFSPEQCELIKAANAKYNS